VTWAGNAEIARTVADVLEQEGFFVHVLAVSEVVDLHAYDAVVIGSAIHANRWQRDARRFVSGHLDELRRIPVWMFSSGPLDALPPTPQVDVLMERVGTLGHVTFSGNPERVRGWAERLAAALPTASAGPAREPPGRSLARLVTHGLVGWGLCAVHELWLLEVATPQRTVVVRAIAAAIIFGMVAWHYFSVRGARDPLPSASFFTGLVVVLDLALRFFAPGSSDVLMGFAGTWLPWLLVFVTTYVIGVVRATLPWSVPMRISEADAP